MPLSTGEILINRYRIVRLLGQGGFGAVYRAWDLNLSMPCALKENFETSQEAVRQFAKEATILANLHHPNLPRVTDHFSIAGQGQYLVMEYIEGQDLQEKLDQLAGPLSEYEVLPWMDQILAALEFLHHQNPAIIHRDIKPANIRIKPAGQAMLVDFGIAKVYDPHLRTTVGARAVTPGYSPFEQYGRAPTDARTDIYALGATLYNLLTAQDPPESIARVAGTSLPLPSYLNPSISRNTEQVILRAMQVLPDQRYQNVSQFRGELKGIPASVQPFPTVAAASPVISPAVTALPERAKRKTGIIDWRLVVGLLVLGVVAVLAFLTFRPGGWLDRDSGAVVVSEPTETGQAPTLPPEQQPSSIPPDETVVSSEVILEPTATHEPIRVGGWLDQIVYIEEPSPDSAINRLNAGELSLYADQITDQELYWKVQDLESVDYLHSFGSYSELTFNPLAIEGQLNPFSNQRIREAMHWLVDRNFIADEIYGGLARPKYTVLDTFRVDYERTAETRAALEEKYAYNPDLAYSTINQEMASMGAEMVDGRWLFNGQPIVLIALIRTEDERLQVGDYVSNLLEEAGFSLDRRYLNQNEAFELWGNSDPAEGLWHFYTGGWYITSNDRNQSNDFDFYFTPRGSSNNPLWQVYSPPVELDTCAIRLDQSDFASFDERTALMNQCLVLSNEFAVRIFLVDRVAFTAYRMDVVAVVDQVRGVAGAPANPFVMRYRDHEGGTMVIGVPGLLDQPWNPIAGTGLLFDLGVQHTTQDYGMMIDPLTTMHYPQRIERAELFVRSGLPVTREPASEDWLSLELVPEISVPGDAWVDWDPVNQVWITAAEKFPEGVVANQLTVVHYPADLFATTWHDGSQFSIADVIMRMIITFDRGMEASPIYDPFAVDALEYFLNGFKGIRIVSENPLVIETYSDTYTLEAELIDQNFIATWYPTYDFGPGAWHNIGLGWLTESSLESAFSEDKAVENGIEWMNYVGGQGLAILGEYLNLAQGENFIPYGATLRRYISEEQAAIRWENLRNWYNNHGHFWIGTGPYFLDSVSLDESTAVVKYSPAYIDRADRWSGFRTP